MSSSKLPPYMLLEQPNITESVNFPLKSAQRIKYTCFDVSRKLIVFGATSGGLYVFNRTPCEFVQLIPNKDGAITRVAISQDEKHIGFTNGRGLVTVTDCDQALCGNHNSVLSKEHQGNEVTALVWSGNILFTGDDVGKISVLQLQSFAKTIFQSSSQTIMSLDSRICQLDVKHCMLLVSTLSRSYICDTSQEQYRQIGQKLRDGDFGACFVTAEKTIDDKTFIPAQEITEVKKYNKVDEEESTFAVNKKLENTLIFCARPSSRLWEATIDGAVKRTHQFKQVLAKNPMNVFSLESYTNECVCIQPLVSNGDGRSINFAKLHFVNGAIFSFKKDALYFLNVKDVDNTMWFESKEEIIDCKVYRNTLYLWLNDSSLVALKYLNVDKFLLQCYFDEKYSLCAKLCILYTEYLLSDDVSPKLNALVGLKDKLVNNSLLNEIGNILDKFDSLKCESVQTKCGIYVVDNTYHKQTCLFDDDDEDDDEGMKGNDETLLAPEALQTFKDLSITVSDKLHSSKKMLKEKWGDFEEKMKYLGSDKQQVLEISLPNNTALKESPNEDACVVVNNDIIYKESSQKAIEVNSIDNNNVENKLCKLLYQYFRLSLVGTQAEQSNLTSIIESYACDISKIYDLMISLEQYCLNIEAIEESKFVPNHIFLSYLDVSLRKSELLNSIINDDVLYKYFVDCCISVNMKTQKMSNLACECGFPLPYNCTNKIPAFSELIDQFIEQQWSNQTREQCYEICKRMPYLWRKILYLRRNEDLMEILRILLQILDEKLLHSFLPQFTLDIWDYAIELYATLHANICLNCNKKFDNISVKDTLSWDDLGALMIKSVGARKSIKMMERHAELIDSGELTVKFYHSCLMVAMYEKYDSTLICQLTDTLYTAYDFEDSRREIFNLLRNTEKGIVNNTALPLIVAAKSDHWGMKPKEKRKKTSSLSEEKESQEECYETKKATLAEIVQNLRAVINVSYVDCTLCGLPLKNDVLIQDGGLWVFKCGHIFHGACLNVSKIKLCPC